MPNDKDFELDDLESFSFDDFSVDDNAPGNEGPLTEDPLGVWVKSAPEDVEAVEPLIEPEGSEPANDDLAEEDFLSGEELANLDDSFEFVTVSEEPLEGETNLDDDMAFLDTPEAVEAEKFAKESEISSSYNDVSLDDFVSFDELSMEDEAASEVPRAASSLMIDPEASAEDDAFDEEFLDIDIDIEDDINDEELEIVEGGRPKTVVPVEAKADGPEEVDLSEFVDFEEVSPSSESLLAESEDLPEIEVEEDFFEEAVLDESLPVLEDEGSVMLDVNLEPDDHTDMDSLIALEEDLTSGIRESEGPVSTPPKDVPPQKEPDLATQILGKIEQELSSIKQEISELKQEMTQFRGISAAPVSPAPTPSPIEETPVEPEAEEKGSHGFFDEEDDETIALTGDELDNILSTAEISEGEEVGLSLDEDLLSLDGEGNLVEPEVHVTDEEFLAGTALESEIEDQEFELGVPESIELEESLSADLDDAETEDLMSEGLFGEPESLEAAPDEAGLEAVDVAPLAPELDDEPLASTEDWDAESLPSLDAGEGPLADPGSDAEGWTAPVEDEAKESPPGAEPILAPPSVSPAQPIDAKAPLPTGLKDELRAVLTYMDKLLASLPDDKIQEFAESEHFEVYKRLFEELGLIE